MRKEYCGPSETGKAATTTCECSPCSATVARPQSDVCPVSMESRRFEVRAAADDDQMLELVVRQVRHFGEALASTAAERTWVREQRSPAKTKPKPRNRRTCSAPRIPAMALTRVAHGASSPVHNPSAIGVQVLCVRVIDGARHLLEASTVNSASAKPACSCRPSEGEVGRLIYVVRVAV